MAEDVRSWWSSWGEGAGGGQHEAGEADGVTLSGESAQRVQDKVPARGWQGRECVPCCVLSS